MQSCSGYTVRSGKVVCNLGLTMTNVESRVAAQCSMISPD